MKYHVKIERSYWGDAIPQWLQKTPEERNEAMKAKLLELKEELESPEKQSKTFLLTDSRIDIIRL